MRPKYITVRWHDHHEKDETWAEPTPLQDLKPARVESRGWLIGENDECIEMSAHKPMDKDDDTWGRPFRIVKSAIFYRSDKRGP
jgi:hypothetical protein